MTQQFHNKVPWMFPFCSAHTSPGLLRSIHFSLGQAAKTTLQMRRLVWGQVPSALLGIGLSNMLVSGTEQRLGDEINLSCWGGVIASSLHHCTRKEQLRSLLPMLCVDINNMK